jgi:hypothetical protein
MEVEVEAQSTLQVVDECHEVPRNTQRAGDRVVARLVGHDAPNDVIHLAQPLRIYDATVEQTLILLTEIVGKLHTQPPRN